MTSRSAHANHHRPLGSRAAVCGAVCGLVLWVATSVPAQGPAQLSFPLRLADSAPDWMVRLDKPTGCLASIPRASMHPVPVLLQALVAEYDDTVLTLQAALLAQDVSDEFRRLLGAKGDEVPVADSVFPWYSVPTELVIIAHRDGQMSMRPRSSTGDSAATLLLTQAFEAARARDRARLIWPERLKADSILVRLSLWPAYVGFGSGQIVDYGTGLKFITFYHAEPERSPPVSFQNQQTATYPTENLWNGFEGYVLMQFVVDSTGRIDAGTMRDLWPAGKRRLSGEQRTVYDDFFRSVRVWESKLRYAPARIGPCAVKQQERQPIVFKFKAR